MNNEDLYNRYKTSHPEWSDDQIWAAISIEMEAENVLDQKGQEITANDPDIIKEILDGAKNWLQEVLPTVFAKVSLFFDRLISTIGEWVQKGLTFVIESIAKILGKD